MTETLTMGDFKAQLDSSEADELRKRFTEGGPGFTDLHLPTFELTASSDTLAGALARVQEELPQVLKAETATIPGKEGKQGYKYSYADLAAVSRAILPILGKHGLSWVTKPTLLDGRFVLVYKLLHGPSGEVEEGVYPLPDRGSPQDVGSAITYARRYCLCSVSGVAPDDDDDAAQATANHSRNAMTTPPMSDFERRTGLAMLRPPTDQERRTHGEVLAWAAFVQALDFQRCINEKGSWRQPSDPADENSPTWEDLFTTRVAAEIAAVRTPTEGRRLHEELKGRDLDMTWSGSKFSALLRERALSMQQDQAHNASNLTSLVVNCTDRTEMGDLASRIVDARDRAEISEQQFTELHGLHNERLAKLDRQAGAE